jgi:hypothetical protein
MDFLAEFIVEVPRERRDLRSMRAGVRRELPLA